MMKNKIYRYIGVILVIVGIVLIATGITYNESNSINGDKRSVETIDALDDEMTHISSEKFDDKIANNVIGAFMVIVGTFFLSGHYLMLHRKNKNFPEVS